MAPTASASEFSSAAASAEASASAAGGGASGGTPSFPCPDGQSLLLFYLLPFLHILTFAHSYCTGFLLSYVQEQATVELPLESVIAAAPEWGSDDCECISFSRALGSSILSIILTVSAFCRRE